MFLLLLNAIMLAWWGNDIRVALKNDKVTGWTFCAFAFCILHIYNLVGIFMQVGS